MSPNYVRYVDAVPPDDPGLPLQWGVADVRAGDAWQSTTGSSDVVVASIDTGVDVLHPDLAANMWHNPGEVPGNGVDDDGNGYVDDVYGIDTAYNDSLPMDDYGHGTHTAGVMAAAGDNALGVAGLGWSTKIMALKFINYEGAGTDADAIECIDYAVREKLEHGVNVVAINASWGGGASNRFLRNAIDRAGDADIVFVASAGNDEQDNDKHPHYPSSLDCPTMLTVAATASNGRLARFSNWGRVSVDLAAPGEDIMSTLPDGHYDSWSGTSMAAPFVTGAVALCAARYPGETAEQRVDRILGSVRTHGRFASKLLTEGTLDVAAALGVNDGAGDVEPPVTAALGGGDAPYDVPVAVSLFATDGAGGSGVAATEWRVDGGAWRTGTSVVIPAPDRTRRAQVLEYRSIDRAGNPEAPRQLSVAIDTTRRAADADPPGVPLPPSPVTGGLDPRRDRSDVYRLRLRRGESIRLSVDGPTAGVFSAELVPVELRRSDVVRVWYPAESLSLSWATPRDGAYYLAVSYVGYSGAPQHYRFSYEVIPAGTDVVAPEVRLKGYTPAWLSRSLTAEVVADDGRGGSGVARVETSRDDGLTWTEGASVFVDAPADHSNDGHHFIRYRAVDAAGNVSAYGVRDVRIDTQGPSTQAWGPARAVRRGARATIQFRVTDLAQWVRDCRLLIHSATTGRLVGVKRLGGRLTADSIWWNAEFRYHTPVTCTWPAGAYTVTIAGATRDPAGNRWESATCERLLVVRK